MRSFLTGSYAYGVPHDRSDIDLVVLVTEVEYDILATTAENQHELAMNTHEYRYAKCLRFGKLNLICCLSMVDFETWRQGTRALLARKKAREAPITRDEAKEFFANLRKERAHLKPEGEKGKTQVQGHGRESRKKLFESSADDIPY